MIPQQISNPKRTEVKTIALEVCVPAEQERVYIQILDRLNERKAQLKDGNIDLVLDKRIGFFFLYYAKADRPKLFEELMIKQNTEMKCSLAIPIFGFTNNEQNQMVLIDEDGITTMLIEAIKSHIGVYKIVPTASSNEIGKFLIITHREDKESVEDYVNALFQQIPELPNQPMNFKKTQHGGNAFKQERVKKISTYLTKLEQTVNDELGDIMDDESSHSPPKNKNRRFTISYAQATKTIQFNKTPEINNNKEQTKQNKNKTTNTIDTTRSTLTQSVFEETLIKLRAESENSMNELRREMAKELVEMENRITSAVSNALKAHPVEINTNSSNDSASAYTTAQEAATVFTLTDKVEELTEMDKSLAETVHLKLNAPPSQPKRNRGTPTAQITTTSPPSKVQRARPPTPPKTPPPPNGHPTITQITNGAREET